MLWEKINNDLKEAMLKKEALKVSVLRMLRHGLQNLEIEKKVKKLEDGDVLGILAKEMKKRKDAIEGFTKGNRPELAEKEKNELEILQSYMPEPLSREEVAALVKEAITETGASTKKDMGKVMKFVMEKAKGRVDGKTISEIVSGELQ